MKAGQERWYERSCAQFIREGLSKELGELGEFAPAKRPKRMPVVLNAGVFVEGVVVTGESVSGLESAACLLGFALSKECVGLFDELSGGADLLFLE